MIMRWTVFVFGGLSYGLFLFTFLYAVGFVGGFGVPRTVDGPAVDPVATAVLLDVALLAVFALQHSVMARAWFKDRVTRFVPVAAERSLYVLASNLALLLLYWQWRPIGGTVWDIATPGLRLAVHALCALGWATVLAATFLINHFDLFGLRQVWLFLRGRPYTRLHFATPAFYGYVRHPLYVGWMIAFWAAPTMGVAHFVFAAVSTAYILIAIQLEERDLVAAHGAAYLEYRSRVPMLLPTLRHRSETVAASPRRAVAR